MARTRELDIYEIRVLGALMEKELQTPDHYPLTISAVIAAANQKSNRNPVTNNRDRSGRGLGPNAAGRDHLARARASKRKMET